MPLSVSFHWLAPSAMITELIVYCTKSFSRRMSNEEGQGEVSAPPVLRESIIGPAESKICFVVQSSLQYPQ